MTGAWRFKNQIPTLQRCHPETCPSSGEVASLKYKKFLINGNQFIFSLSRKKI
jgi:hypothetical protein